MLPNDLAVLVVGHGTRKPSGQQQLKELVEQMRRIEPSWRIEASFLELAEPTIEQAIEFLSSQQVRRILVVPILLFTAAHAKSDIPDAVAQCAQKHGIEVVGQTTSLGTTQEVIALSNRRYHEITSQAQQRGCPQGHCGYGHPQACAEVCPMIGKSHRRVALAMVGRGTSDPEALAHMRRVTELASQERSLAWVSTGFFAGGIPSVDELLAQAAAIPSSVLASSALTTQNPACDTVVIQPHLLFEGELMDQLRARILRCRQESPDRRWILARCLGADDGLAGVFIEFIRSYQGLEGLTESTGESLQES
ncbi:MAG: sirohydrochlorin cobaltochelatase [Planctomycetota bacterium]|nr:sirohydrochlorin cobaltochelatase [Planctomycetota bacterium]